MFTITIHQQTYTTKTLPTSVAGLPPEVAEPLRFCQEWLAGQKTFVLKTSGSTGTPKPITLQRKHMVLSANLTGRALNLQAGDSGLVCLSTAYIAGCMMLVRGMVLGLHLTVIPPTSTPLAACSPNQYFDFTALVPMQLQHSLSAPDGQTQQQWLTLLNRMKAIIIGGAPVTVGLQHKVQQITAPLYHTYGMTETVSHIALRRLNGDQASDYFKPLAGVVTGQDKRGCLTIQAGVTDNQCIVTNDRVARKSDGSFRWLGRLDNVINSGGVKVQAETVERAIAVLLSDQPQLANRRFFVSSRPHETFGQMVIAVIEGTPTMIENSSIESYLLAQLRTKSKLSLYEIPRHIYLIPQFKETATGKIDRLGTLAQRIK